MMNDTRQQQQQHQVASPQEEEDVQDDEQLPMVPSKTDVEQAAVADDDDEDNEVGEEEASTITAPTHNRSASSSSSSRRRSRWRFRRAAPRVGAPSWWTELQHVETTGCTFAFAYVLVSFFLMAALFNMREIVGDYCLGKNEIQREEYHENMVKAMGLRRRSPWDTVDQEDRFEKESEANLFYDHKGQLGDDTEYLRSHRVPIIRPPSNSVEEDDADEEEEEVFP